MRKVKIGIIGFGTVGRGVYDIIMNNGDVLTNRTEIEFSIKTICDLNVDYIKSEAKGIAVTDKWEDVAEDPDIEIILELIGGIHPAKEIIMRSLENGKSVVTANKKLLAEDGDDIFDLQNRSNAKLGFEASVGGGIPCILSLRSGLVANRIRSVMGILNGTTNYILTKMEEEGVSFGEALTEAQEKGFAEADPTFDIMGHDAGHKISLLSMIAFNRRIDFDRINIEGITRLTPQDIENARTMGYVVKLLGIAKIVNDRLDIRVHPTMISEKSPLASVRMENNAVMFHTDRTDPIVLTGKGAGSQPTASAVISDVVQIAERSEIYERAVMRYGDAEYVTPDERFSRYYMRIHTEDRPGILAQIARVLGDNKISISSVMQHEDGGDIIPLIITTSRCSESAMNRALRELDGFDFIKDEIMIIPLEDLGDTNE